MKTRKELKKEYKLTKFRMGVFAIRNVANGKIFIGNAPNLDLIWNSQKFKLDLGGHTNEALQRDWKTFGAEKFVFEVLHELKLSDDPAVDARAELKALEELTIEEIQPFGKKGYNRAPVAKKN
jgi:hypothetical protein